MTEEQTQFAARFPYQNAIGAILFLSINTRPDLSYSVGLLTRHCIDPSFKACQAVLKMLTLLRSTPDIRLDFNNNELNLDVYSDANWAGDHDSRQVTTGYVVIAARGPMTCQLKLQTTVAASTMEA